MKYSLIIPVFNREDELTELLQSASKQHFKNFTLIVVDDGSTVPVRPVIDSYKSQLNIQYLHQKNQGPGIARNYGASIAESDYLIFLDSDCLLPEDYLNKIDQHLSQEKTDFFGGPDRDHESFSNTQKAINYAMTSFLTTGGIRGGARSLEKYKPRSFNFGVSKSAFDEVGGYDNMRFGEDIDLSLRLEKMGFKSRLIEEAFVYHKRRTNLKQFFKQVYNSGMARIHLTLKHPGTLKAVHRLPALFTLFLLVSVLGAFYNPLALVPILWYLSMILINASLLSQSLIIGLIATVASIVQLVGYGSGFLNAWFKFIILKKKPEFAFSSTFYD